MLWSWHRCICIHLSIIYVTLTLIFICLACSSSPQLQCRRESEEASPGPWWESWQMWLWVIYYYVSKHSLATFWVIFWNFFTLQFCHLSSLLSLSIINMFHLLCLSQNCSIHSRHFYSNIILENWKVQATTVTKMKQ